MNDEMIEVSEVRRMVDDIIAASESGRWYLIPPPPCTARAKVYDALVELWYARREHWPMEG